MQQCMPYLDSALRTEAARRTQAGKVMLCAWEDELAPCCWCNMCRLSWLSRLGISLRRCECRLWQQVRRAIYDSEKTIRLRMKSRKPTTIYAAHCKDTEDRLCTYNLEKQVAWHQVHSWNVLTKTALHCPGLTAMPGLTGAVRRMGSGE